MDGDLIRHRHQILIIHLSGRDPMLQRVQGYMIATNIEEVAAELQRDVEEKDMVRQRAESKGVPKFLETNLT